MVSPFCITGRINVSFGIIYMAWSKFRARFLFACRTNLNKEVKWVASDVEQFVTIRYLMLSYDILLTFVLFNEIPPW